MSKIHRKDEIDVSSFTCKRLRDDKGAKSLKNGFQCLRNGSLASYLKYSAYKDDCDNHRAVYIIREKGRIVLYFSLQCGLLIKSHKKILGGIEQLLEDEKIKYIISDDKIDVTKVLPGVELGHFCINDSFRKKKHTWTIEHGVNEYTVGVYVFYTFIAPRIIEIAEKAGMQFVYLFCADDGSGHLLRYYTERLGFSLMDNMACIRQQYDKKLSCFTIKIEKLIQDTNHFQDIGKTSLILEHLKQKKSANLNLICKDFGIKDSKYVLDLLMERELIVKGKGLNHTIKLP